MHSSLGATSSKGQSHHQDPRKGSRDDSATVVRGSAATDATADSLQGNTGEQLTSTSNGNHHSTNVGISHTQPKRRRKSGQRCCLSSLTVGTEVEAPDGTKWEVIPTNIGTLGRRGQQNILRENSGPSPYAKRCVITDSPSSAWRLFIDEPILKHIQKCTEAEARRVLGAEEWSLPLEELDAFLAILYVRGATESKGIEVDLLWSEKWGMQFYRSVMSRNRFREIMRFLRFDVRTTRSERLKTDKFALMSEVWDRFIKNCQTMYIPGPYISVDEQLFPSKCRCRFTQFMASKPDKYGQKYWMAVDKDSKYMLNAFPYLGKDETRPGGERLSDFVVKKLVGPYLNKGRNVTCDNFFTSLSLARQLKTNRTSLLGTMNKIRREVPECVKKAREDLYKTVVFKNDDITLTVYQAKPGKNVIILSSLHQDVHIGNDTKSKPDTVISYNESKYGVDVVDQMARKYSVKAGGRRWPVHTFYNILDLAGINAWVLYKEVTNTKIMRRDFLLKLADELAKDYTVTRVRAPPVHIEASEAGGSRRRCQVRKSCREGKSAYKCASCEKPVCKKCVAVVSYVCADCKVQSTDNDYM